MQQTSNSHEIEFSMKLETTPDVERTFLYIPANRVSKPTKQEWKFYVVEKIKRDIILLTVITNDRGVKVIQGEHNIFSRKDTERAIGIIGDSIANRISAATQSNTQH